MKDHGGKKGVSDKTPHRWMTPRECKWLTFCWRCGLVSLKNAASAKAVKAGCFKEEEVIMDMEPH